MPTVIAATSTRRSTAGADAAAVGSEPPHADTTAATAMSAILRTGRAMTDSGVVTGSRRPLGLRIKNMTEE
jgi:hypothetical protein